MRHLIFRAAVVACFLSAMGCSSSGGTVPDASTDLPDAATPDDAGSTVDAGIPDAGAPTYVGWEQLDGGPSIAAKQDDVYFLNESLGWSVNGGTQTSQIGHIYKTTDSGASWQLMLAQPGTYFRAITFFDENLGFAGNIGTNYYPGVTDTNALYTTTNGGTTWTPVTVTAADGGVPKGICNFSRVDDQHIFATGRVGGPAWFLASSDRGTTWKSTNISSKIAMLVDSHFSDAMTGVITGGSSTTASSKCVILRTEDGGGTWTNVFTSSVANRMCWKLSFPTDDIGYAAVLTFETASSSTILKTIDGGKTWSELPLATENFGGLGIGFINANTGWVGGQALTGSAPQAYRTDDGAMTWTRDDSLGPYINRFRFIGDRVGYSIGSSIYKLKVQ